MTTLLESDAPTRQDGTITVWMADDDQNDHLLLSVAAEAAGVDATFEFFVDGSHLMCELAVAEDADALPDLILLDFHMPEMDGYWTLEALKSHPVLWRIPVVVFSASRHDEVRMACYSAGASWYVPKPYSFGALTEFVGSLPTRITAPRPEAGFGLDALASIGCWDPLSVLKADVLADVEDHVLSRAAGAMAPAVA